MIFEEKRIILKDGREAIFKTPEIEDADKMLDYIKKACGETDFLMRYPEEWNDTTVENEKQWIENNRNSPNSFGFACYIYGRVVGDCNIEFKNNLKNSHRALIGIAVHREYWNLGIGSAMFNEMIDAAKKHGTEIMELDFVEGNNRARHLYEKFGFKIVAEIPNAIKLKGDKYLSEFRMQKYL